MTPNPFIPLKDVAFIVLHPNPSITLFIAMHNLPHVPTGKDKIMTYIVSMTYKIPLSITDVNLR